MKGVAKVIDVAANVIDCIKHPEGPVFSSNEPKPWPVNSVKSAVVLAGSILLTPLMLMMETFIVWRFLRAEKATPQQPEQLPHPQGKRIRITKEVRILVRVESDRISHKAFNLLDLFKDFCSPDGREIVDLALHDIKSQARKMQQAKKSSNHIKRVIWWRTIGTIVPLFWTGLLKTVNAVDPLLKLFRRN